MDMYGFYTGTAFDAHEYFGAHLTKDGVIFRTFAPEAQCVSLLLGSQETPMQRIYDGNFYELALPGVKPGDPYEYRIYDRQGGFQDHSDPYGFAMELRPAHKSVVCDLSAYAFGDDRWMRRRSSHLSKPLNIYELHLGSWRRSPSGTWLSYAETARQLIPYLKEMGYNYVECMPIAEHPCDESWGYQQTGFFSATSRYGTPQQLMEMVDLLHRNDIGVILDFVPVHFAVDAYALARYDGTPLYEYPHSDVGMSEWGSCNFIHARGEVRSFLQSAAHFWLSQYHFDGLHMDAVSRLIYWQGDERRGENKGALQFLKTMNAGLKARNRGCMLIAEDSTNYPGVTASVSDGGLGFDYKWAMGWMHDTLEYFQLPPQERTKHYHKLTFSMMYFRDERYLLPLSHDEVVHGKATILQKMCGQYEEKFPQARAMYLFMMLHPGKKMNFMANEFGQLREWDEKREQDWMLLAYPIHDSFRRFMADLNAIYLGHSALYAQDYAAEGFSWIDCHQESRCIYAIKRQSKVEVLAAVFNFSSEPQTYRLPLATKAKWLTALIHTDWEIYGGRTRKKLRLPVAEQGAMLDLPPFSGMLFKAPMNAQFLQT